MTIVAIVLAKNETKNIARCVAGLEWCDEIVVIDDASSDNTKELVKNKARVLEHALDGDFSQQRNWAMEQVEHDWIFFVDADEVVSDELAREIQMEIRKNTDSGQARMTAPDWVAYRIKRDDWMISKFLHFGETGTWNEIRLMKRDCGTWEGKVHERFVCTGDVGQLDNHLQHYPHETMSDFLQSVNNYSSLRSRELHAQGVKADALSVVFYPMAKFMQNYFFYSGWRDGSHGMVHAIVMSLHSFLVRGKLYLLGRRS